MHDVAVNEPLPSRVRDRCATEVKSAWPVTQKEGSGRSGIVKGPCGAGAMNVPTTPLGYRNLRMMHLLEGIASRFNAAHVPLMVLKGAALNLTLYERPDQRAMGDLDLLVRTSDVGQACALFEELGGLRGEPLVREDFFPRFHYELEYTLGGIYPVRVDLHVRPFRPLRYSRTVPEYALWRRAQSVTIGAAQILVPCAEDMLIHLCVHAAVHGCTQAKWTSEIGRWVDSYRTEIDWKRFVEQLQEWRLVVPAREALRVVGEGASRSAVPRQVVTLLNRGRVSWCDRLALWQAPRDAKHPAAHVGVNILCTPDWKFRLSYLRAVLIPDKAHMSEWYGRRHPGWLILAHLLRCLGPVGALLRAVLGWRSRIEVRPSPIHGLGVFATRGIGVGEVVARYFGRGVDRDGAYVVWRRDASGRKERFEIMGKLKFLNHSCRPNTRLSGFALIATEPICEGQEITIEYESATCACGREHTHAASNGDGHPAIAYRGTEQAVAV